MSEVEGQKTPAEGQIDVEKLIAENQALKASKERILNESKDWKEKAQTYRGEIESKEKAELEKQGEYEVLLQKERERSGELQSSIKSMQDKIVLGNIKSAIQTKANDALDVEALLRMPEASEITYDPESLEVNMESVESVTNKLRESRAYMFKKPGVAPQATGNPDSGKVDTKLDEQKIWEKFISN